MKRFVFFLDLKPQGKNSEFSRTITAETADYALEVFCKECEVAGHLAIKDDMSYEEILA